MKSIIRCCRMRSRSSWTNTERENKKDPISKMFVVQIDIFNVHCWGDLWLLMICFIVRALISLHSGTKPVFVRWRWESEQHDTSAQEPWEPLSSALITENPSCRNKAFIVKHLCEKNKIWCVSYSDVNTHFVLHKSGWVISGFYISPVPMLRLCLI